tara:strand:- start:102 stop:467 length:366 start_codon:yes stop_codon:yes gene_type:complete
MRMVPVKMVHALALMDSQGLHATDCSAKTIVMGVAHASIHQRASCTRKIVLHHMCASVMLSLLVRVANFVIALPRRILTTTDALDTVLANPHSENVCASRVGGVPPVNTSSVQVLSALLIC